MPLNPEAVGLETEATTVGWTSADALLYAVGIGAGADPDTDELAYTTENSDGVAQQVFPTFTVVAAWGNRSIMGKVGTFDTSKLVHGAQAVTLHQPLPVEGTVSVRSKLLAMHDKGTAAVVVTEMVATDLTGAPLFTNVTSSFIRGAGGWGGERGTSGPRHLPPTRPPDQRVTYATRPEQALIYRLSGDRNPLHSDPAFAVRAGFERPILHGLCTHGFTGRALLHSRCAGDAARFQHMEGRFTAPVFPGEELTISIWDIDDGEAVFTTSVGERVVMDQGYLRYA